MDNSKTMIAGIAAIPLLLVAVMFVLIGSDNGTSCATTPDGVGGPTGVTLAGLGESQLRLARDGVAIGKQRHESEPAIVAELAAQATESGFRNLANPNVPESLHYPNDGVGSDHDSVGPHQMRAGIWGSAGMLALMSPKYQINWFYDQVAKLGDRARELGSAELAQAVEQSAPDVYAHNLPLAQQIFHLFIGIDVSSPTCAKGEATLRAAAPPGAFGAAVIAAAGRWIGTPYIWGGGDTVGPTQGPDGVNGFDCSGLTLYAVYQASGGRITLPHYTQAQQDDHRGRVIPLGRSEPGDLIYFTNQGSTDSHHVAIYLGRINGIEQVLNAPATGQRIKSEPLSDWAGQRIDVRRFGWETPSSGAE